MYKKALAGATTVVAVSDYVKDRVKKDFGIESVVIPLSVDSQKFEPAPDKKALRHALGLPDSPVICMVSSIEDRRKRADMIIKAMPAILENVKDATLVLAGKTTPEIMSYLSGLAHDLGIEDHVTITGRLDDLKIRNYLAASDIFVLPSKEEAGGLVVLEAMATGLPVICSNSGGITEYIHDGYNGVLFDCDSVDDLADKVVGLIQDRNKAGSMAHNARELAASKYSWGSAVRQYMSIYKEAVKS